METKIVRTEYDDLGRSWVVIPDEMWYNGTLMTYVNGMDIDYPVRIQRKKCKK